MRRRFFILIACALISWFGAGCVDGSSSGASGSINLSALAGTDFQAVVTAGGGTGSYAIIADDGTVYENLYTWSTTDLGITVYNDSIFVYGRYGLDWMTRFDLANPTAPVFSEYKTVENWEATGNPREAIMVSDDVGYVFRYDSPIAWIIDPTPADETVFQIGEIYLFDYVTSGNPPNPVKALVDGTTMYVVLERSNGWAYDVNAILLTFDISTPAAPVITDEHNLIVRSPNNMVKFGNRLYIAGWGATGWSKGGHTPTGGIEEVDISGGVGSYASTLIVDDDDPASGGHDTYGNAYLYDGFINDVAIASATEGFIFISEWNAPTVYKVLAFDPTDTNPATGVDTANIIMDGINLSRIAVSPDSTTLHCSASNWGITPGNAGMYTVTTGGAPYVETGPVDVGLEPIDFRFNN